MNKILLITFTLVLTAFSLAAHTKSKLVKVAIIDTGLDTSDPRFSSLICPEVGRDFTGAGLVDNMGHGTHIAGIIKDHARNVNYCFIILKYTNSLTDSQDVVINNLTKLYYSLYQFKPDIVNFSGGGAQFLETESLIIKDLKNTKFFVASGNRNQDLKNEPFYPAALNYPNLFPVSALDGTIKADFSNWGERVKWEQGVNILSTVPYTIDESGYMYMSGTSQATAIYTGQYLYEHY